MLLSLHFTSLLIFSPFSSSSLLRYGTALGVVRSLHEQQRLAHVYCTETRPYNQGSRLTAYELVYEKIPATLIVDSMASILMKKRVSRQDCVNY